MYSLRERKPELSDSNRFYDYEALKEAIALEACIVHGLIRFPQDPISVKDYAEQLFRISKDQGFPEIGPDKSQLLKAVDADRNRRAKRMVSAGLVGTALVYLHTSGNVVSLNRACTIVADIVKKVPMKVESANSEGKRIRLPDNPKNLATIFREYRPVVHYCSMAILGRRNNFGHFDNLVEQIEIAEAFRGTFEQIASLDTASWGMRRCPDYIPVSRTLRVAIRNWHTDICTAAIDNYVNPNWVDLT